MRPQGQLERHTLVGFDLVLNPVVPQMAEQLVEVVDTSVHVGGRSQLPLGGVQGSRPGQGSIVHAMSLFSALAVEYISPAPAVSRSPAPVVESIAPAPAVCLSLAPVVVSIA